MQYTEKRERERKKSVCVCVRERKKEESCSCLSLTGGVGRHALLIASELECREGYLCSEWVGKVDMQLPQRKKKSEVAHF